MELFLRGTLIAFAVGIAVSAAVFIGGERADVAPMKALQTSMITYGLLGASALVWWPTPDVWAIVGKCVVLGLFALDLARDVAALKWPKPPVFTAVSSWTDAIGALLMLVCVVFLWP